MINLKNNSQLIAYAGLITVVFIWGVSPVIVSHFLNYFSASVYTSLSSFAAVCSLLIICAKNLKELNKSYLKVAIPTGIFNALGTLLQKIGLPYTTPAQYAFLENLSCIVVPVLLFILIKKKPGKMTILSCALCLVGVFILSGISFSNGSISFGIGELLCALAGVSYGFNIALTGVYAKNLRATLYVMIQMCVTFVVSLLMVFSLNVITVNGAPLETAKFTPNILFILAIFSYAILSNTVCWTIRTNAAKKISPTVIAIIMPMSAVITSITSIIFGFDTVTINLVLGALLLISASILSSADDVRDVKKRYKEATNSCKNNTNT